MDFYTSVELSTTFPRLLHSDRLMLLGSCFATHMGLKLINAKFACDVNPYGVLYNPLSISAALREMMLKKKYTAEDLFYFRECWHSSMHHGDFSSPNLEEVLNHINNRLQNASESISNLSYLLLTFGSAWIYESNESGKVVGNCHKQPEACFTRRKLSVDEIVNDYKILLQELLLLNPELKIIFTVSPIRHIRDGMHANNLSKATLLLAIEQLQLAYPNCVFYFPAYEMLLDELRDYRFYAEDMLHPSDVAIRYVWGRFVESCVSKEALQIMEESEKIRKALSHKPFNPNSDEHKRFLGQIVLKIDQLNEKYPYLDFQKEREVCHIQLKT